MALVPLLPEEADELLATGQVSDPVGDEFGAEFLRLVGAGASQADIAKHLGMSSRTVERKFALLRERVGVGTRAALVAELARRGW
jgi:DNA-binding CsgD family transcriptional regulator